MLGHARGDLLIALALVCSAVAGDAGAAPRPRRPAAAAARAAAPDAAPAPPSVATLLDSGRRLVTEGRYEEAIPLFTEALLRDPKQSRALLFLGLCRLQLKQAQQAMALFERFQDESATFLDQEALEKLQGYYTTLAGRLSADYDAEPGKPELLLLAGRAAFRAGKLEQAGALYRRYQKAAGAAPQGPMAKVGEAYLREYFDAVVRRERARLTERGAGPETYLALGEAYLGLGDDEAAIDAFDAYRDVAGAGGAGAPRLGAGYRALTQKLDERVGPALLVSGRAHFGLGHGADAHARYARYRAENPSPPLAYRERLVRYLRDEEMARLLRDKARPVYKRWWFWTAVGAIVAGGATAAALGGSLRVVDPLAGVPDENRRTPPVP